MEADGSIDPAKADADWARQTDPAMQRWAHSHRQGTRTAAETAAVPPMKPVPRTAIRAVDETLRESGEGEAGQTSFMRARMANEVLKAQIARERLKEMKGESVDRARAVAPCLRPRSPPAGCLDDLSAAGSGEHGRRSRR